MLKLIFLIVLKATAITIIGSIFFIFAMVFYVTLIISLKLLNKIFSHLRY